MKPIRAALLAIACSACAIPSVSLAQWMWVDKDGRKVLSDQAPPNDIPAKNILRQPGMKKQQDFAAAPVVASEPAKPVPLAAKAPGKDPALEAKKKAADAAEAEKQKAANDERDRIKAENCANAKRAKANFDSGARIARTNAKGEREFLDDATRAADSKRVEGIIAKQCAPAAG
ncbi:DUF4124 domain-containing protein [Caenimonas sp. SL110]|uniref:DUF4124 domain-containing protein n=1 Tax=Caenimonas sp. SL110 TaxID=1450524 RepID=UPI0006529356|nr:DUF4124 domain-containing protein [Caenimonas sp. SL110]